ncbi:ArsR/SmtB family transcription factor [Streptomyces sp. NPDC059455]|uniref:ArsR/SmtB family transcription factor n=1 Tax=Streptomyces sp. NPDC059455 TaxID=3346837 RepID=UPI0036D03FFD
MLEIRMPNGVDHDLRLEGQGIVLVPSVFGVRSIVDNSLREQPTVTYPVQREQPLDRLTAFAPESGAPSSARALAALLGRTRAVVLRVIADHPGCSTKDLASLTDLAPASASEHATVLREAGLVITRRYRNTALHSLNALACVHGTHSISVWAPSTAARATSKDSSKWLLTCVAKSWYHPVQRPAELITSPLQQPDQSAAHRFPTAPRTFIRWPSSHWVGAVPGWTVRDLVAHLLGDFYGRPAAPGP